MQDRVWEIISAKINGELLSLSEEEELLQGMDESPDRRLLFHRLEKYYRACRAESKIDVDAAYEKYLAGLSKVKKRRQERLYRYVSFAAAVVVAIVFTFAGLYWDYRGDVEPKDILAIRAGESKALLTMASGVEVPLSAGKSITLQEQGGIINNENEILVYTADTLSFVKEEAFHTVKIPRGGEYRLILEDGTKVWLNAESRLVFPVVFAADQRRVVLEGEGFFEVVKDSKRPFIVTSGELNVRVLGTSFNITAYEDLHQVVTTLVEGVVRVEGEHVEKVLKPGEQAIFTVQSKQLEVQQVDVRLYTSWKEGYYMFEKERLEDIMNTLARWYDVDVFYETNAVRDVRFSGRVKRYGEILEFLETIKLTQDVDFKIKDRTVFVTNK